MKSLTRVPQLILGLVLTFVGFSHLSANRTEFQAQVPTLLKKWADQVVLISGVVEIILGLGLVFIWKYREQLGWATAFFFVAVFWGNISQYLNHADAFGLNSDQARLIRLFFQPLLVIWALVSTGAWNSRKRAKRR